MHSAAFDDTVAIIGRRGSGKTYTAKGAIEPRLLAGDRVCIIDPTGVWWGLRAAVDGKGPGLPVVVFGGLHADVPITEHSGRVLAGLVAGDVRQCIIDVSEFTIGARTRFATDLFDELYQRNRDPLRLLLDEADVFAPQRPMPDATLMFSRVEQIVRRGRVRGFHPWLITQRPAELHKSVLSQADTLIAMRLTAPQDREAFMAWVEHQADRNQAKEIVASIAALKKGEGWLWAPEHGILKRMRFPSITTYDSSATPDKEATRKIELAPIDLDQIRAQLAEVTAEVEKNDPKKLRARIAELEKQLEKPRGLSEPEALAKWRAGYDIGKENASAIFRNALQALSIDCATLQQRIDGTLKKLSEQPDSGQWTPPQTADITATSGMQFEIQRIPPIDAKTQHMRSVLDKLATRPSPPSWPAETKATTQLPRAQRLILTALAQYPQGRSKVQIAILTGYAVTGGGFQNSLGALRSAGHITKGEPIEITEAGRVALGPYDPLPHGRALLDHWLNQLGRAERKIMEALCDAYPRSLSKEQIASRAGYEAKGGGFQNALGKLRTLELIRGRAEIKSSDDLFD